MSVTRKEFFAIAKAVEITFEDEIPASAFKDEANLIAFKNILVANLSRQLKNENPSFDNKRFELACKLGV